MFKLYKRGEMGEILAYHEVWVDQRSRSIVEHWGMLGERGETATHRIKLLKSLEKQIDALLAPAEALGFHGLDEGERQTLIVEYTYGEDWRRDDIEKIRAAEDALTETLGWTGLGTCEGETHKENTVEFTCRVIDIDRAEKQITEQLMETEFSDYSRIYQE